MKRGVITARGQASSEAALHTPGSFVAMADDYRRNAVVDVTSEEFQRRLRRWRPRSPAVWSLLRRVSPALVGMARNRACVMEHRLCFLEGGRSGGEPVVLLHGFGSSKENWLALAPLLGRRHRIIAPDLPGFGESGFYPDSHYGLGAQAERMASFIHSQIGQPVHLVGSSMGGGIAGLIAARFPEIVRSVTLMNAAGVPGARCSHFEQMVASGRNELIPRTLGETAKLMSLVVARGASLGFLAAPLLQAELVHRYGVNHRVFSDILGVDVEPAVEFSRIQVPALVLWGERDRVLDVSSAEAIAHLIPGSRRIVIPDVGHLPMIEAPFLTARALREFWSADHHE
jgi:pimeloyl-ACP methyl ester carboxylesterase